VLLCATLLLVFVPLTLFVADAIRGLIRQRRAHRKLGPQEFAQQLNHLVFELRLLEPSVPLDSERDSEHTKAWFEQFFSIAKRAEALVTQQRNKYVHPLMDAVVGPRSPSQEARFRESCRRLDAVLREILKDIHYD